MNAYYNTIDFSLYLQSGLMPNVEMSETNAKEQSELLTDSSLSPVAVTSVKNVSLTTANVAVLSMAKTVVKSTYKIEIKSSELLEEDGINYWSGSFILTNYSDEEDVADSNVVYIELNDDLETVTMQKIEKMLNKGNTDDLSITGLFEKEYDDFCVELTKYALKPLTTFYEACQSCIDILIDQGIGNNEGWSDDTEGSEGNLYEKLYLPYYNKLSAIEAEIKVREDEINVILGAYNDDGDLIVDGLQPAIEHCRDKIQNSLNFEHYLGEKLWLEFCAYRREDKYTNDNYISDGLDNAELFKKANEFFKVAENEIYKSAELQHSISATLNNLLAIPKFKPLVKSFDVGNWIRVLIDGKVYKLRLLEYGIKFGDFNNIPVDFSDISKIKNGITDVKDVLSQASSMATSYSSIQRQADKGYRAKTTIEQWISNGLNSANVKIQNNDNEDIVLTKNGILCRSYDDITNTYSPEQLRLTHNIMAYTNDEWKTVRQAIGKHEYILYEKDKNMFVDKTGYGMNADFVTAGVVSGSQIIGGDIYSDNYSVSDRTGSYLNLRDGTFSFGGGSLRFEGGTLLISSPNVVTKNEITEINEEYLKTTSVYAENLQVNHANIDGLLTADQIDATGLKAESADISGTITTDNLDATGGEIGGWTISEEALHTSENALYLGTIGISDTIGGTQIEDIVFKAGSNFGVTSDGAAYVSNLSVSGGSISIGENFSVSNTGVLNCRSASIGGTLTAGIGSSIGGFSTDENSIFKGAWGNENTSPPSIYMCTGSSTKYKIGGSNLINGWCFGAGTAFGVTQDGSLYASKANITGGRIGNWNINDYGLISSDYETYIYTNGTFIFNPDAGYHCGFLKEEDGTEDYSLFISAKTKLKIGSTSLSEEQLKNLLALI
jgi:hypothetical protein